MQSSPLTVAANPTSPCPTSTVYTTTGNTILGDVSVVLGSDGEFTEGAADDHGDGMGNTEDDVYDDDDDTVPATQAPGPSTLFHNEVERHHREHDALQARLPSAMLPETSNITPPSRSFLPTHHTLPSMPPFTPRPLFNHPNPPTGHREEPFLTLPRPPHSSRGSRHYEHDDAESLDILQAVHHDFYTQLHQPSFSQSLLLIPTEPPSSAMQPFSQPSVLTHTALPSSEPRRSPLSTITNTSTHPMLQAPKPVALGHRLHDAAALDAGRQPLVIANTKKAQDKWRGLFEGFIDAVFEVNKYKFRSITACIHANDPHALATMLADYVTSMQMKKAKSTKRPEGSEREYVPGSIVKMIGAIQSCMNIVFHDINALINPPRERWVIDGGMKSNGTPAFRCVINALDNKMRTLERAHIGAQREQVRAPLSSLLLCLSPPPLTAGVGACRAKL